MDKRREAVNSYKLLCGLWTVVSLFAVFLYKLKGGVEFIAFGVWLLHAVFIALFLYHKQKLKIALETEEYNRVRREFREQAVKDGKTDYPDWV